MRMMEFEYAVRDVPDLVPAAHLLLQHFADNRIFLFEAEMGTGKTTFIKAICAALGSSDAFSSPTFSLVNTYSSSNGPLYHFDLYRVRDVSELYDMGMEEYLDGGAYCFIEWPQLATPLLQGECVRIVMEIQQNNRYIRGSKVLL
jgi:tRNA threonylcarbamoyladenosine biosynthesis protein TsaE